MKTNTPGNQVSAQSQGSNSKRPDNKDNLDSRENEEQSKKGNDTTHNKKEKQSEGKSNHKAK